MNPRLGQEFRRKRRAKGWTQGEAAEAIGVHQPLISHLERGVLKFSREKLRELADALGVTLDLDRPEPTHKFCPSSDCPGNLPFATDEIVFRPTLVWTLERHCRLCGEVLLATCPDRSCRAEIDADADAFCGSCGVALVPPDPTLTVARPDRWASEERSRREERLLRIPPRRLGQEDESKAS